MFTGIDLEHFKCFALLKLPLRPLTLLSGANASGKSSVVQALVLLHQTVIKDEWSNRLLLNGGVIRLGTVADVVDQHARRSCRIAIRTDEGEIRWEFAGEPAELSMAVMRVWMRVSERYGIPKASGREWQAIWRSIAWERHPEGWYQAIPRDELDRTGGLHEVEKPGVPKRRHHLDRWGLNELHPWQAEYDLGSPFPLRLLSYLSAERTGPQEIYPLEEVRSRSGVGSSGEYAMSVLYAGRDEPVPGGLEISGVPPTRLRQVEAWMARFFPGCELDLQKIPRANAVTLGLRTAADVNLHAPVHTGYGLTQVLPIIVAALSAAPGDLLLIENPEVHLHPMGQAAMGVFLATVAAAGIQVLVETHSDHVLNGIRRAVRQGTLAADDVALHFFRPRQHSEREGVPQVESPTLDAEGNVDRWPDGFFDQFDKDMNYLAGWG